MINRKNGNASNANHVPEQGRKVDVLLVNIVGGWTVKEGLCERQLYPITSVCTRCDGYYWLPAWLRPLSFFFCDRHSAEESHRLAQNRRKFIRKWNLKRGGEGHKMLMLLVSYMSLQEKGWQWLSRSTTQKGVKKCNNKRMEVVYEKDDEERPLLGLQGWL